MGTVKWMILISLGYIALLDCAEAKSKWYDGDNRPYDFGFDIHDNQHRKESKDEKGRILGEFGFVTGDGHYHVTMYGTDENGNYKIFSKKTLNRVEEEVIKLLVTPEAQKSIKEMFYINRNADIEKDFHKEQGHSVDHQGVGHKPTHGSTGVSSDGFEAPISPQVKGIYEKILNKDSIEKSDQEFKTFPVNGETQDKVTLGNSYVNQQNHQVIKSKASSAPDQDSYKASGNVEGDIEIEYHPFPQKTLTKSVVPGIEKGHFETPADRLITTQSRFGHSEDTEIYDKKGALLSEVGKLRGYQEAPSVVIGPVTTKSIDIPVLNDLGSHSPTSNTGPTLGLGIKNAAILDKNIQESDSKALPIFFIDRKSPGSGPNFTYQTPMIKAPIAVTKSGVEHNTRPTITNSHVGVMETKGKHGNTKVPVNNLLGSIATLGSIGSTNKVPVSTLKAVKDVDLTNIPLTQKTLVSRPGSSFSGVNDVTVASSETTKSSPIIKAQISIPAANKNGFTDEKDEIGLKADLGPTSQGSYNIGKIGSVKQGFPINNNGLSEDNGPKIQSNPTNKESSTDHQNGSVRQGFPTNWTPYLNSQVPSLNEDNYGSVSAKPSLEAKPTINGLKPSESAIESKSGSGASETIPRTGSTVVHHRNVPNGHIGSGDTEKTRRLLPGSNVGQQILIGGQGSAGSFKTPTKASFVNEPVIYNTIKEDVEVAQNILKIIGGVQGTQPKSLSQKVKPTPFTIHQEGAIDSGASYGNTVNSNPGAEPTPFTIHKESDANKLNNNLPPSKIEINAPKPTPFTIHKVDKSGENNHKSSGSDTPSAENLLQTSHGSIGAATPTPFTIKHSADSKNTQEQLQGNRNRGEGHSAIKSGSATNPSDSKSFTVTGKESPIPASNARSSVNHLSPDSPRNIQVKIERPSPRTTSSFSTQGSTDSSKSAQSIGTPGKIVQTVGLKSSSQPSPTIPSRGQVRFTPASLEQAHNQPPLENIVYRFHYYLSEHGQRESGDVNGFKEGQFSIIDANGLKRTVKYRADADGFHPEIKYDPVDPQESRSLVPDVEFKWFPANQSPQ